MKEVNDPGIKLFGKKIPLPGNANIPVVSGQNSGVVALREVDANRTCFEDDKVNGIEHEEEEEVEETEKNYVDEQIEPISQEKRSRPIREVSKASPESNESPKTPSVDEETAKPENDESDTTNSEQKTLKKPDKILPCPRCNSMDTKFCYYNNYNVNQPRHFCKSCQRYWTAGGIMRNVPVGAGRRRNKNSDLHCHHITISEALHVTPIDAPQRILSFGSDSSLRHGSCVLNLAGENVLNSTQNGFYKLEQGISVSCKVGEYGDNCSSGSSSTTLNSNMEGRKNGVNEPNVQNNHGFPAQVPLLPGVSWPCPWNSAVTVPTIFPMGFPSPYYPTPYWNCNVPCSWGNPWLSPPSPITNQKSSPMLGKHSREGDLLKPRIVEEKDPFEQNNTVGSVLVPKTVRIDELDEASRSSIWANLGINNDSVSRKGLFKGFQLKKDEKSHAIKSSPVLQANPAALSRSLSFQERA